MGSGASQPAASPPVAISQPPALGYQTPTPYPVQPRHYAPPTTPGAPPPYPFPRSHYGPRGIGLPLFRPSPAPHYGSLAFGRAPCYPAQLPYYAPRTQQPQHRPVSQATPSARPVSAVSTVRTGNPSALDTSPPPSPPPEDEELQEAMLRSYGEQNNALREMTWPPPSSQMPSAEMLLTDQDIKDGERFIAAMEEKRVLYESIQRELYDKLHVFGDTRSDEEVHKTYELITNLCQTHHYLYGGDEDEMGIEFMPAEDAAEDGYILEQMNSLTRRHHLELVGSDRLCSQKLLEGRGPGMTEQKLDSILEEHIKLRSYMRTRQTRDQIAAYHEVQSSIKENPSLYRSSRHQVGDTGVAKLITEHPIFSRLPPLTQSKLKSIGTTRGKTMVVDTLGQVSQLSAPDTGHATSTSSSMTKPARGTQLVVDTLGQVSQLSTPDTGHAASTSSSMTKPTGSARPNADSAGISERIKRSAGANTFQAASIWARVSSDEDEPAAALAEHSMQSLHLAESASAHVPVKSADEIAPPPVYQSGFTVVTADPRYIAAVNFETSGQSTETATLEPEGEPESNELERTGVISGTVSERVTQFSADWQHDSSEESDNGDYLRDQRAAGHELEVDDYEDDFDDDDDLVAHYQQTLKGDDAAGSADEDSVTSSEKAPSPKEHESSDSESEHNSLDGGDKNLIASARLKDEVSEAIWENQGEINPQSFHALITMWQDKQKSIVSKKQHKSHTPSSAIAMWQKVRERVMYDAIASAGAEGVSDEEDNSMHVRHHGEGVSTSMQTSMTRNQSTSAQTQTMAKGVDVATLVDEFFVDEEEKKKIKKLDKKMIAKLASGELTDEDFRKLLARNRDNVEKIRKQRAADRLRSLQQLKDKRGNGSQFDDEEDEDDMASDGETTLQLQQIEQKVASKLIKHRDTISDRDMKNLLNEARKQQDEILRQRNIEKLRQRDEMKERLIARRNAKKTENGEPKNSKDKLAHLEDRFYNDLRAKLASGDLTHAEFKELIDEHLTKIGGAAGLDQPRDKRKVKKTDSKEEHALKAQSIIRRGHEKNKAIQDVRQRERENAAAELKQKRRMKKDKSRV